MKKFALFAMLLASCMIYGCQKPKETPPVGEGEAAPAAGEAEPGGEAAPAAPEEKKE
ncbi:MAG: hypothetical protein JXB10_07425 [Pirellulales bacterium]|nr:hypothetical protein [Pirellulales bacterium]